MKIELDWVAAEGIRVLTPQTFERLHEAGWPTVEALAFMAALAGKAAAGGSWPTLLEIPGPEEP